MGWFDPQRNLKAIVPFEAIMLRVRERVCVYVVLYTDAHYNRLAVLYYAFIAGGGALSRSEIIVQ